MTLKLEYIVKKEFDGKKLGEFLLSENFSRKAIIKLKHSGGKIIINDKLSLVRTIVNLGDKVIIEFPPEEISPTLIPYQLTLDIIYEDEYLLVINKAAGIPVIPTGTHQISLANGILHYYKTINIKSTIHFVNRLDRETSGLLIIAKYRHIHHLMTHNIENIIRKYIALVENKLVGNGTIEMPIFRPDVSSIKRTVNEKGQYAKTDFHVIENKKVLDKEYSLVECALYTGRTHQIRVHLSSINHPIVKDKIYNEKNENDCSDLDYHLLHSYFLEFNHPITNRVLTFKTDLPDRFEFRGST